MKTVKKPWGKEEWLELNDQYCYKRIYLKAGYKTSLQVHEQKLETNYVISGKGFIYLERSLEEIAKALANGVKISAQRLQKPYKDEMYLELTKEPIGPGYYVTIQPGTVHMVEAITDLILQEVSTPQVDDVIRLRDSTNRPDGRIEEEHA